MIDKLKKMIGASKPLKIKKIREFFGLLGKSPECLLILGLVIICVLSLCIVLARKDGKEGSAPAEEKLSETLKGDVPYKKIVKELKNIKNKHKELTRENKAFRRDQKQTEDDIKYFIGEAYGMKINRLKRSTERFENGLQNKFDSLEDTAERINEIETRNRNLEQRLENVEQLLKKTLEEGGADRQKKKVDAPPPKTKAPPMRSEQNFASDPLKRYILLGLSKNSAVLRDSNTGKTVIAETGDVIGGYKITSIEVGKRRVIMDNKFVLKP